MLTFTWPSKNQRELFFFFFADLPVGFQPRSTAFNNRCCAFALRKVIGFLL